MGSVDDWLCQNIHQIFGGSPAGYPRLRVESVMGFLLLRRVCSGLVSGGNASLALHCGPRLGELSGGNLNSRSQQHVLYCAFAVGDWGRFFFWRSPSLVQFRPLRRSAGRTVNSAQSAYDCYLVDSASSHMLVSKIKPCMSKYKQLYRETANGSLNQLSFI